jgi:hypothetical protein
MRPRRHLEFVGFAFLKNLMLHSMSHPSYSVHSIKLVVNIDACRHVLILHFNNKFNTNLVMSWRASTFFLF